MVLDGSSYQSLDLSRVGETKGADESDQTLNWRLHSSGCKKSASCRHILVIYFLGDQVSERAV